MMHSRLFIRCKYIYLHCILSYLPCIIIALKFVYVFLKYLNQCWDFLYTVTHMIICYMEKHLQKCALFLFTNWCNYLNGMEKERGCKMGCPYSSLKLWCLFSLSLFGFIFSDSYFIQRERETCCSVLTVRCIYMYIMLYYIIIFFHVSTIYFTLYLQL